MAVSFCVVDYLVINEFVNYSLEEFNIAKINFCASVCVRQRAEQLCCSFGAHSFFQLSIPTNKKF